MVFKVAVSNRFQFKAVPSFRTMLFPKEGEIHYIGGADILPAPLDSREEARLIGLLGTEQEKEAKAKIDYDAMFAYLGEQLTHLSLIHI